MAEEAICLLLRMLVAGGSVVIDGSADTISFNKSFLLLPLLLGATVDMGEGNHANKMEVNIGRYTDGSLPVTSIAAENVTPIAENTAWVQKCLCFAKLSISA